MVLADSLRKKNATSGLPLRFLKRRIYLPIVLGATRVLLRFNRASAARSLLHLTTPQLRPNSQTKELVSRAYHGFHANTRLTEFRVQRLNELVERPLKQKNYSRLLYLMASYEALQRNAPVVVGKSRDCVKPVT